MPTTFSLNVDTVEVPPCAPLRRARTMPCDEGLYIKEKAAETAASREDSYSGLCDAGGRPYDYPAPIYVRNTFVQLMPGRDPSLDEFFEERRIHSCPASWGPSHGKVDEEVPLASSRTTACGSASDSSAAASTPPQLQSPQLSDTEDMSELTPRVGSHSCAAAIPASRTSFRGTISEYRRTEDNQTPDFHRSAARAAAAGFGQALERNALPPGPIQVAAAPASNKELGYYQPAYQAAFPGYDGGYDAPYDAGYNSVISNRYVNNYHGGQTAGYRPSYSPSPDFPNGHVQEDMLAADLRMAGQPHMVLQLSAAIHPSMQPPPPPGAPAPSPSPLPPPPAPPIDPPLEQMAPTRGSLMHDFGRCKPCAFFHTKGCDNGFECPFCHLCEPGEKKRRRKDKLEARRVSREIRQAFPYSGSIPIGRGLAH